MRLPGQWRRQSCQLWLKVGIAVILMRKAIAEEQSDLLLVM